MQVIILFVFIQTDYFETFVNCVASRFSKFFKRSEKIFVVSAIFAAAIESSYTYLTAYTNDI